MHMRNILPALKRCGVHLMIFNAPMVLLLRMLADSYPYSVRNMQLIFCWMQWISYGELILGGILWIYADWKLYKRKCIQTVDIDEFLKREKEIRRNPQDEDLDQAVIFEIKDVEDIQKLAKQLEEDYKKIHASSDEDK